MNARDRVKLCIEQARNHSGETALRALTNAVEILADQLKDEHVGTYYPPMIAEIKTQDEPGDRTHDSAPNATPAPNLIERLKKAYVFAEMEAIAGGGDPVDMGVRAIFAELAKMPCGLPNEHQIAEVWYGQQLSNADVHYSVKWDRARSVREYVFSCVAPIVTARDAEISRQSQHIEDLGAQLTTLNALVRNLESRTPANEVSNAEREQYERTIELQDARIAKLEKRLAERDIQYETLLRCKDAMGIGRDKFCDLPARIALLKASSAPPTVDGKTPGQVGFEVYDKASRLFYAPSSPQSDAAYIEIWNQRSERERNEWETAALAVLRTFGNGAALLRLKTQVEALQTTSDGIEALMRVVELIEAELSAIEGPKLDRFPPGQTPQTNAADALRRARARIEAAAMPPSAMTVCALAIIDDEIAKLGAAPASNAATPKLFVAENALRGSYFCTEFLFRPFLHIGRYIEFDDIPRILKLGRNDVVEVRVVERAKQ